MNSRSVELTKGENESAADEMLLVIEWGKNPSILPTETNPPTSPYPTGAVLRFLIDGTLTQTNPPTGTLVGFGQVSDPTSTVNLSVYHIANKDQKILTIADNFDVYVQQVCTNSNLPQPWAP